MVKSETDYELLKLAARAAGYEVIQYSAHLGCQIIVWKQQGEEA